MHESNGSLLHAFQNLVSAIFVDRKFDWVPVVNEGRVALVLFEESQRLCKFREFNDDSVVKHFDSADFSPTLAHILT